MSDGHMSRGSRQSGIHGDYFAIDDGPRSALRRLHISIRETPRTGGHVEHFRVDFPQGTTRRETTRSRVPGYVVRLPNGECILEEEYGIGFWARFSRCEE